MVLKWPGAARSSSIYPMPPVVQASTMIETMDNSMTHLEREYSANKMGAGFLYATGNNKDTDTIEKQFREVSGDPHSFPIFTGDGDMNWKNISGDAISLDAVKEQEWFLRLCAALLGVAPQEVGLIKDVNRSTAQEQGSQMFKRLVNPISQTLGQGITNQVFTQFDLYNELGQPFKLEVVYSDPEQERRQEQDSRERYKEGVTSLNEHRSSIGLAPIETVVAMPDGREIAIGELPRPHAEQVLANGEIVEGEAVEEDGES
jgi:phage portal protein BeeE